MHTLSARGETRQSTQPVDSLATRASWWSAHRMLRVGSQGPGAARGPFAQVINSSYFIVLSRVAVTCFVWVSLLLLAAGAAVLLVTFKEVVCVYRVFYFLRLQTRLHGHGGVRCVHCLLLHLFLLSEAQTKSVLVNCSLQKYRLLCQQTSTNVFVHTFSTGKKDSQVRSVLKLSSCPKLLRPFLHHLLIFCIWWRCKIDTVCCSYIAYVL